MDQTKQSPRIALGTWSWGVGTVGGDQVFGNHLGAEELKPVFDTAMQAGLTLWDTAVVYGMGASETILGKLAKGHDDVILSTKFTPQISESGEDAMAVMCEGSLSRLGVESLDLYWIHNPADVERWTPCLISLLRSGKIKQVGVSNHNLDQIKRAEEILASEGYHLSAVQNHYSLLYRSSEKAGILEYCREKGLEFFAYMVLEQGALSGRYDTGHPLPEGSQRAATYNPVLAKLEKLIAAMRGIGRKYGASVSQVAIAWAACKGTIPLVGVTKPTHVSEAASAVKIFLTQEEVAELERLASDTGVDTKGSWENPMV